MFKEREKFSAYFFILALILSATFCFLFLENFKYYSSQITVLFIPKNEKTAIQSEQIAQNLTEFLRNLSFYEKLLNDNKNIKDEFAGHAKDKRKKMWNKKLEISRAKNCGIIEIEIVDDDQIKSEKIAKQTTFTLFSVASRYYNVKNEIDLRIIDGPITSVKVKNWSWLICLSILIGTFLSYLTTAIFSKMENIFLKTRNETNSIKTYGQNFLDWKSIIRRKDQIKKINKSEKESDKFNFIKKSESIAPAKKSQAPSNLPVAKASRAPVKEINISKNTKKETTIVEEPSEEELKERLNQLLKGEL